MGEQAKTYGSNYTGVAAVELGTTVHFTGYVAAETASRYLSGADIGVLPFNHGVTLKSGSLLALLAHDLPVIATRPDPLDRELDGCLRPISPRDVNELAIAITELLRDRTEGSQLKHASRTVAQTLVWDAIAGTSANLPVSLARSRCYQTVKSNWDEVFREHFAGSYKRYN